MDGVRVGSRWWVSVALLVVTQSAYAQDLPCEPVALVVEAEQADDIRAALAERLQCELTSLPQAWRAAQASAVLTISVDPATGISAIYWRPGTPPSWLTVPLPANPASLVDVVTTLATVLARPKRATRVAESIDTNPCSLPLPARRPARWDLPLNPYYYRAARIEG